LIQNRVLHILSVPRYDGRKLFVIFCILLFALTVEISISNVADIISKQAVTFWGVTLFVVIFATYGFGQYFILKMVKQKNRESKNATPQAIKLFRIVSIVQYTLTGIILIVILQIIMISHYYTNLLTIAVAISYGLAAIMMGLLTRRLLSWFRLDRNVVIYPILLILF
jgi:hypothetical protein